MFLGFASTKRGGKAKITEAKCPEASKNNLHKSPEDSKTKELAQ
jgi:hypothetical protein